MGFCDSASAPGVSGSWWLSDGLSDGLSDDGLSDGLDDRLSDGLSDGGLSDGLRDGLDDGLSDDGLCWHHRPALPQEITLRNPLSWETSEFCNN